MHSINVKGLYLGVLLGSLAKVLQIDLPAFAGLYIITFVDRRLQSERVLAIDLLPVDGSIRAVDGLMAELHIRSMPTIDNSWLTPLMHEAVENIRASRRPVIKEGRTATQRQGFQNECKE